MTVRSRTTTCLFVTLAALALAACGTSTAPTPTVHVTPLLPGHAVASPVEGIPVPAQAKPIRPPSSTQAVYGLPGVTSAALDKWYHTQLPPGQDWHGWKWVSPTGPGCGHYLTVPQWTWTKGGQMLQVVTPTAVGPYAGHGVTLNSSVNIWILPTSSNGAGPLC